jgi:uncharacterized membrane protein
MRLSDLQELINAGIISPATAEEISEYYRSKKDSTPNRLNVLLGILGALLVGAGIVLVVAHNWDSLSKPVRTVFAFLPMVAGQALCAYTLLRKKESMLWRESCSVLLFFGTGTAIALVSQVYQITGSLGSFTLTWLMISAPLVYIMNSSATSLLVIALATWYGWVVGYGYSSEDETIPWYYLLALAFIAPHYYQFARKKPGSLFFHFHNWFLALSFIFNIATLKDHSIAFEFACLLYLALFCVYYLIGSMPFFKKMHILTNPFLITGFLGSLIILLIWSFQWTWSDVKVVGYNYLLPTHLIVLLLLLATTVALMIYYYITTRKPSFDPVGLTVFIFLACLIIYQNVTSSLLVNLWILVIGLFYIRKGNMQNHFGILNVGLLIILTLAIFRFFDDQIPFVWRGIFFLVAGAGFFAANYLMVRKKKAITQNINP